MKKKYFSLVFLLKNTKKILVGIKPPCLESLFLESKHTCMCMCLHINGLLVCFFDLENTMYFCCIPEMFECCTCVTLENCNKVLYANLANVLSIYWWQIWNELTGSEVLKDAYTRSIVSTF